MRRFQFALSDRESVRETGIVTSDSFADALATLSQQMRVQLGDRLDIGVAGFPPARFVCTVSTASEGVAEWRQIGRLAA